MATEAQGDLYQTLKEHQSDLEIQRDAAPGCGLEDRIEATRRVLQWLDHQAFEIEPQASPAVQTPPSSPNPTKGLTAGPIPSSNRLVVEAWLDAQRPRLAHNQDARSVPPSPQTHRADGGSPLAPIREGPHFWETT
jgi:hypothetical protein